VPSGGNGVIETINSSTSPVRYEDFEPTAGTMNYLKGKGTYVAKGNGLTPINSGLKNNFEYTVELHEADPNVSPTSLKITFKIKTLDCTKPNPTVTSVPTFAPSISPFQQNGTPTPTPDQYFTCKPDPSCTKSGKNIQLCPLLCTPQ
jgi:hypothetical protein